MKKNNTFSLPPLLSGIKDGNVSWKAIQVLDYELVGYFLSCHLIIEHYLDEFLKSNFVWLDWDAAKPTFAQRIALLSNMGLPDKFNCIPAIKHMNTVRNKLSHRIDYIITEDSLLPMTHYLQKMGDKEEMGEVPTDPKELLSMFTTMCCSTLAGNISRTAHATKQSR